MVFSKKCEYGIRASLYLATLQNDGYVSIRDISDELDISFHFLTKVFQDLSKANLMDSLRGPNGGVSLARPANQIHLMDVILAIDGPGLFRNCMLGLPGCGNERPCPMHEKWAEERERLSHIFSTTTLATMAHDVDAFDLRLKATGSGG